MTKRIIVFFLLLGYVLVYFTGCGFIYDLYTSQQEIKKLPELEFNEDGDVVYNGCIYKEFWIYGTTFYFKNGDAIAQKEYWGTRISVDGYGMQDFNEYVYISPGESWGQRDYLKVGFEFPDYLDVKWDSIHISYVQGYSEGITVDNFFDTNELSLRDISTEVNYENFYDEIEENWCMDIQLTEYESLYLRNLFLYRRGGKLYLSVENGIYLINDEYQVYFENAIKELENQNLKNKHSTKKH